MSSILALLIILSFCILIYWLVLPRKWRTAFLLLCSVLFISFFSIKHTAYFLLNIGIVYAGGHFIRQERANKKRILQLVLIWLIGNLCFFKYIHLFINAILALEDYLSFIPQIDFPAILFPLGLSYIIFRSIHYIVEVYRQKAPSSSFIDFAAYVLFFPTFLSGPVERFPKFHAQTLEQKDFDISYFNDGLLRIVSGIIKKFIVADYLRSIVMPVLSTPEDYGRCIIILAVYGLAIQIYMDFSGYTDMALGVSKLFGYTIMENFNYPYFKKNIALFWRNWHISVYSFIRDYFFFPLFGYRASTRKIYIGVFCTMLVFMLWHEGSLNFLLLGIYHGLGLIIWNLFQEMKRKYAFLRRKKESRFRNLISTFITFSFVSFGFVIFVFNTHQINQILSGIF